MKDKKEKFLEGLKNEFGFRNVETLKDIQHSIKWFENNEKRIIASDDNMAVKYFSDTKQLTLETTYSNQIVDYDWIVRAQGILESFKNFEGGF